MPRPTTKADLLATASEEYEKLWKLIASMSEEVRNADFNAEMAAKGKEAHWSRDKNLRDVLVHLHEWHKLFILWESENMSGANKHFLPEPYTWKTYGYMNAEFWKKHQSTSYVDAVKMLNESHKKVMDIIDCHSNEELFAKKYYSWTDGLGSYCVSVTSSHYNWAIKKIKHHIKLCKASREV